jgi:signal transduction histidine kinase
VNIGRALHQPLSRLRPPRPTVRWRLTLLYSGLFLICGAGLLAITDVLVARFALPRFHPGGLPETARHHLSGTTLQAALAHQRAVNENWYASQRSADVHRVLTVSGIALAIMTLVSGVLGWVVAGRVLAPLSRITETTERISDSTLHERLALTGPRDELRLLADTIDGLLERLQTAFEAQRRFVANASHELRTPLAMMRTFLDVAIAKPEGAPPQLRALDANLRGALDQTDRLLESFLMLARAQNGLVGEQSSVQLEPIITTALTARAAAIAAQQIDVRATLTTVRVAGAETLLSRMVENVIENAVRHNQRGGEINVDLQARGDRARFAVESSGPPLDPDAVANLAQPFTRLGQERTGSHNGHGLGLSIVAAVAAAHDGTLELSARPGGGLRVGVSLPLAATIQPAAATA